LSDEPAPIGIFDSGVGGLSVLKEIRYLLPGQPIIYLADQAHVPYGPRSLEQVRYFSTAITRFLLDRSCKVVVVACNAASAAALHELRKKFDHTLFVGMEPAVKPAAETTQTGIVGVLATPATFQGALYASVVERFASGVQLLQHTCPGLVSQIEAGRLKTPRTRAILENALLPMLAAGIDTVVLGCTHYPFVIPLIQEIVGPAVRVVDPAPAVARQTARLLEKNQLNPGQGNSTSLKSQREIIQLLTTGNPDKLTTLLPRLVGVSYPVERISWKRIERLDS
jgi:glutamate racemase